MDIRCPGTYHGFQCKKKFGDFLEGEYRTTCPRCKKRIHIERRGGIDIKAVVL